MEKLSLKDTEKAAEYLKQGKAICFPTDTVYGLAGTIETEDGYEELVKIKKRPPEKPFTLMCTSNEVAKSYLKKDPISEYILDNFFPGQVTLIAEAKDNLPHWITLGTKYIGIRVPAFPSAQEILRLAGGAALVTSCNHSGEAPITEPDGIMKVFDGEVAAIVYQEVPFNVPSTIVQVADGKIKLIRQGKVPFETIEKGLKDHGLI